MPDLLSPARKALLARLIAIGFAQAMSVIVLALMMREALGYADSGVEGLPTTIVGLLLANLVLGVMKWREHVTAEQLGQDYIVDARLRAFRHLTAMSAHAQSQFRGGSLQLRFVNDLTALRQWVALGLARMVVSGIVLAISVVTLAILSPALGCVILVIVACSIAGALGIGRSFDLRIREARKRRGRVAANIGEKINNLTVMQAFANVSQERRKVRRQANRLRAAMIDRASVTGLFRGFMVFMVSLGLVSIVALGAYSGKVTDTLLALTIFSLISPSLFQLGRVYEYYKSANIAHAKLSGLFDRGPLITPAPEPQNMPQRFKQLRLERVSVDGVLENISLRIRAGDRIVVQGSNGAGKSTLISLILRLIEPDDGSVTLNGRPLPDLRTGQLRRCVSIISPHLPLLKGTVCSNIAYGSAKAGDEDIQAAAKLCAMDLASPKSPFFADREVAEGGGNLSAGERMRIIMARALVSAPQLLLLDEPESHLDRETLSLLRDILRNFSGAWLLATHSDFASDLAAKHWRLRQRKLNPQKEPILQ